MLLEANLTRRDILATCGALGNGDLRSLLPE